MAEGNPKPPSSPKPTTLILGLGNDILTDDAVGLQVAAALRERFAGRADITVSETGEMGLSLLDFIVGFERLVIIDAVQTHQAPLGFVHELRGEHLTTLPAIAPHFLGLGETLALGRKLGLSIPSAVRIFAIEVQDPFTVGTKLTAALSTALPAIVEQIFIALRD
jgi:hydrogenase maturation protease